MGFDGAKESFQGRIKEVAIGATSEQGGTRGRRLVVGGSNGLPFHWWESESPNPPLIAMDVVDTMRMVPDIQLKSMGDVVKNPVEWARKCDKEWGADMIVLKLQSANPEEEDRTVEECESTVREVLESVAAPLVVYGCGFEEKDAKLMEAVSNAGKGERLFLGHAEEKAYKSIAAAAMSNGHGIVAFSNLDINLAKQINILLTDFGVKPENIIMDPLMAPLGMGLEYSYSVIERLRIGALMGDPMLQIPMICDCSCAWTVPEVLEEGEQKGPQAPRGVNWETITAQAALVAGASIVILRHPESAAKVKSAMSELRGGA